MEVRDIMTAPAIAVGQDENVTADGAIIAAVRESLDGVGLSVTHSSARNVEIMSRGIVTAAPGDSVETAARTMAKERVRRLPVTENGRLVGMVSLCDMARRRDCREVWTAAMQSISANISRA